MRFVVDRPTHVMSTLRGVFNQALVMEAALTSSEFVDLFFDLCGAFVVRFDSSGQKSMREINGRPGQLHILFL
jgi:hypothetical protein